MDVINRAKGKLHRIAFATAGKVGSCEIEDTVVIAGSPRSGTTLLLEALSMLPEYKVINEPLLRQCVQEEHGFHHRTYFKEGQSVSVQRKFLLQVLQGQMDPTARWLFKSDSGIKRLIEHSTRHKLLVKFCRINRILPWFAEQFEVRGIIFIIRHPCAVVSSMIRYGQWEKWTTKFIQETKYDPESSIYLEHLPGAVRELFAPVMQRVSTQAEALTLIWCLDQYLPLIHADNHPWILVPYERLISHPHAELTRITDALDLELNNEIVKALDKPSSSVLGNVKKDAEAQLSKWKQQLTPRQIDDILSIVDAVNLSSLYSDSIEPHYEQINALQRTQWQW